MRYNFEEFAKFAVIPLIALAVASLGMVLWRVFNLPQKAEIIAGLENYFALYGYWVVFAGAFFEGLLFINWYLPGSLVAVMGVVFARKNDLSVVAVVALIILAFFLAYLINYAAGRFGWYRIFIKLGLKGPLEKIKMRVEHKGLLIIFSTYIHPNLGALTAAAAGILRLDFAKFFLYSLAAVLVWNSLWGVAAYLAGPLILKFLGFGMAIIFALGWLIFSGVRFWRKQSLLPPAVP